MNIIGERRAIAAGTGGTRRMKTRVWAAVATALALSIGVLTVPATAAVADTAPAAGTPETVSADALPTVQIDGVVYAQEVVGNTVYVGGSFSKARPAGAAPGTNETPRANLLAYDLTTGELISSWNPGANNTVLDIKKSADGTRIYVAGMFSQAAGAWRYRVAAFDTATGALVTDWAPTANGRIDGIAVTDTNVYLAGEFTTINNAQRPKVAAVSTKDGTVTPFSANVQGGYGAKDVVVSPDTKKVVISGSFTSVNGSSNPGRGITALDAITGKTMPWAMNSVIHNGGLSSTIQSLSSDGDSVYGTGVYAKAEANNGFEGSFRANWSDGSLVWVEDCHGDSYDVSASADAVYVVGHAYYCGNIGAYPTSNPLVYHNSQAFSKAPTGATITGNTELPGVYGDYAGKKAPSLLHWDPQYVPGTYTGQSQGPWQVKSSGDYLLVGGEFLKVNGTAQQGIVRFAKTSVAASKQGPRVQGGAWKIATNSREGQNFVSWAANHDRDSQSLKYQVFRQDKGMSAPLYETTQLSSFWNRPAMSFRDTTATPGTIYNYRVKVTDPNGNSTQSDWTSLVTSTPPPLVSGTVYTFAALHSDKAFGVSGGSTANLATVVQQTASTAPSQRWRADAAAGGFTLTDVASGKCLTVTNGGPAVDTDVLYPCIPGSPNQVWIATPLSPGSTAVALTSAFQGKCLSVNGGSEDDGTAIIQYPCGPGTRHQLWTPKAEGAPAPSTPMLTNGWVYTLTAGHSGKVVGVNGTADLAPVVQQSPVASTNQQWRATAVAGGYTLTNVASGKCLTVTNNGPAYGTDVLYACVPGAPNQVWNSFPTSSGSTTVAITSVFEGKCLSVNGGFRNEGASIIHYTCESGARNQYWTLTPAAG